MSEVNMAEKMIREKMDWKGKNIIITGATGFVGYWLTKALVDRQANVIALTYGDVNKSVLGTTGLVKDLTAIRCDIRDLDSLKEIFRNNEVDTVFHLAAQAIVGVANKSPISTFEVNIKGTWNVLETVRITEGIERVVIASTDKVYGEPRKLPITEDHPLLASYPYDASKACADILSRTFAKLYGLPIGVTRCCNIYGGGDLNFSRIIPETMMAVIENRSPVIRSDGTPVRDFIHVEDAVDAYLVLAQNLDRPDVQGHAFNFGSNMPINILDLVKKIIRLSGKDLKPDVQGRGKLRGEIDQQYLSSEKAREIIGWRPMLKLDGGLKKTLDWYVNYFSAAKSS